MVEYAVKEIFATLQGEGANTGTSAIFIRFAGCNLWSGRKEHRERDALLHRAKCPRFCDTDFVGGDKVSLGGIISQVQQVSSLASMMEIPLIVCTGGEPLLQLDVSLCKALKDSCGARLAIETNGTTSGKHGVLELIDWVCVSPKSSEDQVVITRGDELKVIYPSYDPRAYARLAKGFTTLWVQPEADADDGSVNSKHVAKAIDFCHQNSSWRLSLQTHKYLGLR